LAEIDGYANFIYQIDKIKGAVYKERVAKILGTFNYKETHREKYVKDKVATSNNLQSVIKNFFKSVFSVFKK
jgi:hypothetical protein